MKVEIIYQKSPTKGMSKWNPFASKTYYKYAKDKKSAGLIAKKINRKQGYMVTSMAYVPLSRAKKRR